MKSSLYRLCNTLTLGLAALAAGPALGQAGRPSDIDVYAGAATATSDLPNVLLVLDSSANWNASTGAPNCYYNEGGVASAIGPSAGEQGTKLAIEKCALYNLIDALPVKGSGGANGDALFNVALMLWNAGNGAYPRKAFVPLTTTNKAVYKALIAGINDKTDKANNAAFALGIYEAYLYYKGLPPLNGKATPALQDSAAFSGSNYASPASVSCGRNYVILIGNGSPQNNGPEQTVQDLLAARVDIDLASWSNTARAAMKAAIVNAALGNDGNSWVDEMARLMRAVDTSSRDGDQGIVTYAVAVKKGASDGNFPALMNSVANYGGGQYFEATEAVTLQKSLVAIFNQIQAVNSVFASASLPVSLNGRGTYANQIFLGMFRPDADGRPRWQGNLKQYRFAIDSTDTLFLSDASGAAAISGATGFIAPGAVSYWTAPSSFWSATPIGTPASSSDSADGEVVEKGGVAQRLRTVYATTQAARKVYTCVGCAAGTVLSTGTDTSTKFVDTNMAITQADLGVSTTTDRSNLINWLRGTSNAGDETGPTTTPATTVRPSVHGDVLHSRPAVINYGGSTGVVVFYGANDGQLRAVAGNASGAQLGATAGDELWSFVPQEHFGKLKRLRSNTPAVALSTTPSGIGALARDYGVDGPIGSYQKYNGSTVERAILFVAMRRGGRQVYALDVTDPLAPKFLWKVSNASAGMGLLGQTWSEPRAARVKGYTNPVVIFGGGYDADAEDAGQATTMGNAIFVLDAYTGALVRSFTTLAGVTPAASMARSVAADVTLVDTDYDGRVDRAYAVDLGGQVYRVDFESASSSAPADWTVYKVADLSAGTSTGRKFFFAPDVVPTKTFTALMFGSGDREKPLLSATQDHFFQIFDRRTAKGAPATATPITWSSLEAMGSVSRIAGDGCYMALAQGEKVVNAATSIAGSSYFGTHKPGGDAGSNTCSVGLGRARSYAMPLFCVASAGSPVLGGGLPPSPVSGIVSVTKSDGSTVQVPFVIGAPNSRNSAIEGAKLNPTVSAPRERRYWFQETQR